MKQTAHLMDLSVIWKQAALLFPYFDRLSFRWEDAFREWIPRVIAAETEREFHLLLAEFVNLLGDGHTDYSFPKGLTEETGFLPFAWQYQNGAYCIWQTVKQDRAFLYAKVLAVNGVPMAEFLPRLFRYVYHAGDFSPSYAVNRILPFLLLPGENQLETDRGTYRFSLQKQRPKLTAGPSLTAALPYEAMLGKCAEIRLYAGNMLYIRLDDFLHAQAAEEVRAVLENGTDFRGIILDVRENVGGMTAYAARIAELLISGEFHACRKRTRTMTAVEAASASQFALYSGAELERGIQKGLFDRKEVEQSRKILQDRCFREYEDCFGAPGQQAVYTGPCLLLTSRRTVSAAEDFTAMFRSTRRAPVMGTPTCGTTGTPFLQSLSCGGRIRICTVGYQLLDGTEFIGSGIQPDIPAENTMSDREAGKDRVLDQALNYLNKLAKSGSHEL